MKVCMIGGTGLLGSEGARELIARGHHLDSGGLKCSHPSYGQQAEILFRKANSLIKQTISKRRWKAA